MDYDFMACEYNYACSMDNLEKMLEKYLKKVDRLTKEYELGQEIYLKFEKEAAEILYDAAIKRNEFRMAMFFKKRYGI